MTENALVLIISTFCKFSDTKLSKETKLNCSENFVNCSVEKDGQINEKRVKLCMEKLNDSSW